MYWYNLSITTFGVISNEVGGVLLTYIGLGSSYFLSSPSLNNVKN